MNLNPFHKKELPDYESRIRKLERYHGLMVMMGQKAQNRSNELYQLAAYELKKERRDRANMYAREYLVARKVLDFVRNSELMLLRIILRLQTINDFNRISAIIIDAFKNVEQIRGTLSGISLASDNIMTEMGDALSYLHGDLTNISDLNIDIASESAEDILGNAMDIVSKEMAQTESKKPLEAGSNLFVFNGDSIPYEELQDNLMEMIKKGRVDMMEAL